MDDFERRRDALFAAIAAEQRLPPEAIGKQLDRLPETVVEFFVVSHDEDGPRGFEEAFRLIDLLQNIGCSELRVPEPEMFDPVVIKGLYADGQLFQMSMPRSALNLDRFDLLRLIKQRLGIERPTRQTAYVRPATRPQANAAPGAPLLEQAAGPGASAPVRPKSREIALSGRLHQMPIEDLVQIFQMQRKTGILNISGGPAQDGLRGTVGFVEGVIVDARVGDIAGDEAFFALVALYEGGFEFSDGTPEERSIDRATPDLLMEAARLKDEADR